MLRVRYRNFGCDIISVATPGTTSYPRTTRPSTESRMYKKTLGVLVALTALAGAASAQDYPTRPIKFMHGFPPGGNVDIIARLLGNEMSKGLGQSIVIEPKPGVAGSLAAEAVARSEPTATPCWSFPVRTPRMARSPGT